MSDLIFSAAWIILWPILPREKAAGGYRPRWNFFKAKAPAKLCAWYKNHLGPPIDDQWYGCSFAGREAKNPRKKGATMWSAFDSASKYFGSEKQALLLNHRVINFEEGARDVEKGGWTGRRRSPS